MYFRGYGIDRLITNASVAVAAPVKIAPIIAYQVGGHRAPAAPDINPMVAAEIAAQGRTFNINYDTGGSGRPKTALPGGGTMFDAPAGGGSDTGGGGNGLSPSEFASSCVQAGGTMQGSVCVEPNGNKWILGPNGTMQMYSDGYVDRGFVNRGFDSRGYDINDIDNWNKPKSNDTSMSGTTIAIVAGVGLLGLFLLLK